MAEQQQQQQIAPGHQPLFAHEQVRQRLERGKRAHARAVKPVQVRGKNHDHDDRGEPWSERAEAAASLCGRDDEQRHQPKQDEPGVGGEQQQAQRDSGCDPVAALVVGERAVAEQQCQRGERHREHGWAEFQRRHREHADAGHQKDRHRGMGRAQDAAAEREHGPESKHDAKLREQVDADDPADDEGDVGEPVGERRSIGRAEHPLVADREHQRHIAGRRRVEQRGHHRPERALRQRRHPEHQHGTRAQRLEDERDAEHRRAVERGGGRDGHEAELRDSAARFHQVPRARSAPAAPPPGRTCGGDARRARAD